MKRKEGLSLARTYREALEAEGIPVLRVLLYGSVARDQATMDSDIDIAVVCPPFLPDRHEENMELRRVRRGIDARIEPYCLHPDDFTEHFLPLAREVERTGLDV
jgi:predicted nucleotidyltransferase